MLPRYFKHNKLGSLTQQLHTYGFVRHNGEANALGQMVFSREFFRANAASELSRIRRGFPAYRPDESMRTDELPHDGVPTSAVASSTEGGTPESRLQNLQAQHSQLAQVLTALDGRFRDHKQQASYALLAIGEVLARRRPDLGSMISDILMRDDQTIGVSSPRPSNDDDEPPAMSVRESEGAEGATDAPQEAAEAAKSADEVTAARVPQTSGAATTAAPSGQLTLLPAAAEPEGTGQGGQVPAETGEHCSSGGGSDHVGDRCSEERSSGGGSDHGGGSDRASGSESPDQEGEGSDERSDSAGRSSDKSQKSGSAAGSSSGASSGAAASSSSAEPRSEPSDRSGSDGAKTSDSLSSSDSPSKPPAAEGGDPSRSGQLDDAATAGQQAQQADTDMCIEQSPM